MLNYLCFSFKKKIIAVFVFNQFPSLLLVMDGPNYIFSGYNATKYSSRLDTGYLTIYQAGYRISDHIQAGYRISDHISGWIPNI